MGEEGGGGIGEVVACAAAASVDGRGCSEGSYRFTKLRRRRSKNSDADADAMRTPMLVPKRSEMKMKRKQTERVSGDLIDWLIECRAGRAKLKGHESIPPPDFKSTSAAAGLNTKVAPVTSARDPIKPLFSTAKGHVLQYKVRSVIVT